MYRREFGQSATRARRSCGEARSPRRSSQSCGYATVRLVRWPQGKRGLWQDFVVVVAVASTANFGIAVAVGVAVARRSD